MDMDYETNLLGAMHLHLSGSASAPFCIDGYTILLCLSGGTVASGRDFGMRVTTVTVLMGVWVMTM